MFNFKQRPDTISNWLLNLVEHLNVSPEVSRIYLTWIHQMAVTEVNVPPLLLHVFASMICLSCVHGLFLLHESGQKIKTF